MNDKVCKYDPDVKLFKEIGKAQLNVSGNQYRLTFDNGQMNLKLGDLVSCGGIDNGGRFVVVDVHSVYEKEDVADNPKIVNRMEVTVVPEISKDFAIPLPVDDGIKSCGSLRGSSHPYTGSKSNDAPVFSIRTATVHDSLDPYRMNQVKVTYEGDTDPSAEWVKVLTPFASKDNGISCKLVEGDKVLVCTINRTTSEGTKEESFVVGSFYEGDNKTPNGQRKFSTIIRSKNGQYIGFEESNDIYDFLGGFMPDSIRMLTEAIFLKKGSTWDTDEDSKTYKALGGIEMSDYYGLFTIAGSSSKRSITISSPFGTVGIDAAVGITISAPNGNVKIVGKNIDIEAGNNLTLKSGTNIDTTLSSAINTGKGGLGGFGSAIGSTFLKICESVASKVASVVTGLFDFSLLRFTLELFIKPIAGTLKIHSGRYLLLEAGNSEATLPEPERPYKFDTSTKILDDNGEDCSNTIKAVIYDIKTCISKYRSLVDRYKNEYLFGQSSLAFVVNKISTNKNNSEIDDEGIREQVVKWFQEGAPTDDDVSKFVYKDKDKDKDKNIAYSGLGDNEKKFIDNIKYNIGILRRIYRNVFGTNWNAADFGLEADSFSSAKTSLLNIDDNTKKFSSSDLLKNANDLNQYIREVVYNKIKNCKGIESDSEMKQPFKNDKDWKTFIDSIKPSKKQGFFDKVFDKVKDIAKDSVNDVVDSFLPIDTFSNISNWGKGSKGQILMSQNFDSTLSINGQTLKEELTGVSLESLKQTLNNASLS